MSCPKAARSWRRQSPRVGTPPVPMIGHVTSSYHSPVLGRSIALALIDGGLGRMGETVTVALADRPVRAVIGKSRFFDLDGERLHG